MDNEQLSSLAKPSFDKDDLEKTYNLQVADLYHQEEVPAEKKRKLEKLLSHTFLESGDSLGKDPMPHLAPCCHVAVIQSLKLACMDLHNSQRKLISEKSSLATDKQRALDTIAQQKQSMKVQSFINYVTNEMKELKRLPFMKEFTTCGGFLSLKFMEATRKGLKEHGVTHTHPFALWVFKTIFSTLEKSHASKAEINCATKHMDLYTNGKRHPLNTESKRASLWLEIGPHFVNQVYAKRNTIAEIFRHAMCESFPCFSFVFLSPFPCPHCVCALLSARLLHCFLPWHQSQCSCLLPGCFSF